MVVHYFVDSLCGGSGALCGGSQYGRRTLWWLLCGGSPCGGRTLWWLPCDG